MIKTILIFGWNEPIKDFKVVLAEEIGMPNKSKDTAVEAKTKLLSLFWTMLKARDS